MSMKPQDVLVSLKVLSSGWPGSFAALAQEVGLSVSEAHAAMRRAQQEGLIDPDDRPNKSALAEFLIHGIRYVFPASLGASSRGMPTSHAAPPLNKEFPASADDDRPVWPDPEGEQRGYELKPLCRSAPLAARKDAKLYEWLALADALRGGRARERELAAKIVRQRLGHE
jgi:DNA-binding transcriptional MocR family regulator